MSTYGVDVSKWQKPPLNWDGMRSSKGIEFALARASIGTTVDATYRAHTTGALDAGMIVGGYHYLWPDVGVQRSVAVFLDRVGPLAGRMTVLDVEERGVKWPLVRAWAREFGKQSGGHPLGIYISRGFWIRIGKPRLADEFDYLWLAYWPGDGYPGDDAAVWTYRVGGLRPTVWQYGPRRASGLRLDGNAFRGTREQLAQQITNLPAIPDTGAAMKPLEIESTDPVLVHLEPGDQLYNPDGSELVKMTMATTKVSPYGVVLDNWHLRLFSIRTKGVDRLALARAKDITTEPIPEATPGATPEEVEQAVADAIKADRAKATVGIVYE